MNILEPIKITRSDKIALEFTTEYLQNTQYNTTEKLQNVKLRNFLYAL